MISFKKVSAKAKLEALYALFYQSLVAPFDGMWDDIIGHTQHWQINVQNEAAGFFAINAKNMLLNYFLKEKHLPLSQKIFQQILAKQVVKEAVVSTNHPIMMGICIDLAKEIKPHAYLIEDVQRKTINAPYLEGITDPVFKNAHGVDFQAAVKFCIDTINPPKDWLEIYYQRLINRQELYLWQDEATQTIIGVSEARKSETQPGMADVGMIVGKDFRKQGVGTYLLNQAKEQCYRQQLKPICSCEKDNIGSLKAIQKVGFVTKHRLVRVEF